jgi:anti-sigma regulatory factor (Ser/Thr protein kinase)
VDSAGTLSQEVRRVQRREFPPESLSVREARRFVVECDAVEGVERGALELAVSELASNAVLHAGTPFEVTVERLTDGVRVCVSDSHRSLPRPRDADPGTVTGRGLAIVKALSRELRFEETDAGKRVWFELGWSTA